VQLTNRLVRIHPDKNVKNTKPLGFVNFQGLTCAVLEGFCIFALPNLEKMKEGIHPDNYRLVVFKDMSNEYAFLSKSAAETKETIQWEDGNEYPLVKVEVSHKSHPFYTGKAQFVDTAGRIDKFRQKYGKFDKKAEKA